MPSHEKSPTPGIFGEMQTIFLMPKVLTMYIDRAQIAQSRAFVGGRDILDVEAIARHADAGNDKYAFGLVKMLVHRALDEAGVADHRDNLLVLDQLGGDLRRLLRFPAVVLDRIGDRPTIDAAILIDAFEVGVGRLRRRTEIGRPGFADHQRRSGSARRWRLCRCSFRISALAAEAGAIASTDASPAAAKASNTVIVRCIETPLPFVRAFFTPARFTRTTCVPRDQLYHRLSSARSTECSVVV